jgi:hypothetical protein
MADIDASANILDHTRLGRQASSLIKRRNWERGASSSAQSATTHSARWSSID